jgi:hypothetical protein
MFDVRNSKFLMVGALVTSHLILPLAALCFIAFWKMEPPARLMWSFMTCAGILLLYHTGYWGTFYLHVRTFLIALLFTAIGIEVCTMDIREFMFTFDSETLIAFFAGLPVSLFFLIQIFKAVSARKYPVDPVTISFPFRQGTFMISDGGNGAVSPLMNYHFSFSGHSRKGTNKAMAYAVDIVQLSKWGAAAWNLFPSRNEEYPIFGREVICPCDGIVAEIQNDITDNLPFGQKPYNIGNYVAIRSNGFQVLLGHLNQSSIMVKQGDPVLKGQPIARAGNSGWSERPHLHMQAMKVGDEVMWKNEGLPILFDGKNPIKNDRFSFEGMMTIVQKPGG